MHSVKLTSLFLSFSILLLGTIGGWLFALKGIGHEEGAEFLKFGLCFSSILFLSKLSIYSKAKNFLFYQLLFISGFGIELAWFLSCFFLPLLWLHTVDIIVRMISFCIYISICIGNILFAFKEFERMWDATDAIDFEKKIKSTENRAKQNEIFERIAIPAVIYIPGFPNRYIDLVSVVLFIFLVVGFSVRGNYPVLSMAALGITFSVCAACLLQISVYRILEARKILAFEKGESLRIASV